VALGEVTCSAAVCLGLLIGLVLYRAGVVRPGNKPAFGRQATGMLIALAAMLAESVADLRGWSASQRHELSRLAAPVILTGVALLGIGLVLGSGSRGRRNG